MYNDDVDDTKRQFLLRAVSAMGAAGAVAASVPFVASMAPSARTRAASGPVEINLDQLESGQMIRAMWRGNPVWVLKRPENVVSVLEQLTDKLRDPFSKESVQPDDVDKIHRAIRPDLFVAVGICTHLGCSPTYRPEVAPADLGSDWLGGFFCPCHGSRFDLAGRVYKSVPAPRNLDVPPYRFIDGQRLVIGEERA